MFARRSAISAAGLAFATLAPLAYAAQRVFERGTGPVGDPSLVLLTPHVAFYWRAATALWWGGLAAGVVYALVRTSVVQVERVARVLGRAALPVALTCALLAWFLP